MEKIKLQHLLDKHVNSNDFNNDDESIKGIIKLVVISTLKDRAYDFIKTMMNEEYLSFTKNLYPEIMSTTFYDFDLLKEQNRFIIIFNISTYGDFDEVTEYFTEVSSKMDQSFTDIIVDYYDKANLNQYHRIYTHNDKLNYSTIKIDK